MSLRTQIFVNGTSIELLEDISIPTTYAIADIREPQKRTTNYSKTITLPGTSVNNILFAYLFDVHVSVSTSGTTQFNPNLKADVLVLIDGSETFRGFLQLNNIIITKTFQIEYECTMFGNLANIFQTLGDKRLSDLDFSQYNHTYNKTDQTNSWATSVKKNGANYVNFAGGLATGEGYVYPMIEYGYGNGTSFKVEHFFPALYAKTIIDAIFNQNGFTYTSNFFNSNFFKQLVVPFGGANLTLTNTQAKARSFMASNNATTYVAFDPSSPPLSPYDIGAGVGAVAAFQDETTSPNFDTGGVYNNGIYQFTVPYTGNYKLEMQLDLDMTHFPGSSTVTYGQYDILQTVLTANLYHKTNNVYLNGQGIGFLQGANANPLPGRPYFDNRPNANIITSGTTNSATSVYVSYQGGLLAGSIIEVRLKPIMGNSSSNCCTSGTTTTCSGVNLPDLYNQNTLICSWGVPIKNPNVGYTRINLKPNSYFKATLTDLQIHEGDPVNCNNILPDNIKQHEFLSSIIKAFNLYVDDDKSSSNKLRLEPREDFYTSGVTRDWSTKLDYDNPLTITPMGELNAVNYIFKFKEDEDYYNQFYFNKYREEYGYKRYAIINDFLKEDETTELIFSPTPLADYIGIDRVIPKIFTIDNNLTIQPRTSNLRLLYYGGVKTTLNAWSYVSTSGTVSYTNYPYAGHLDDVKVPTFDLNFQEPREVFYTATQYTSNNLFNKYWKNYIDLITDKDSKIVTGYFNLYSSDIANLSFFDTFYFENDLWILNKIYDYDGTQNELTKCEFIKLINYPAYIGISTKTYGGTATSGGVRPPVYGGRVANNNNSINNNGGIGENNFIAVSTSGCNILGGLNNSITEGCNNVQFINTSGCVAQSGLSNVTLINTSGVTAATDNQVIINNIVQVNPKKLDTYLYTPVLSGGLNLTASTIYQCQYLQIGNVVTVSGRIDLTPTTKGATSINITLPVASVFANNYNCGGVAYSNDLTGLAVGAAIRANPATATAIMELISLDVGVNHSMFFNFTYQII